MDTGREYKKVMRSDGALRPANLVEGRKRVTTILGGNVVEVPPKTPEEVADGGGDPLDKKPDPKEDPADNLEMSHWMD